MTPRWSRHITDSPPDANLDQQSFTLGLLPGEGIGPEVTAAAIDVLRAIVSACDTNLNVVTGGEIGVSAKRRYGKSLTREVLEFCDGIFTCGGAILAGAGGDRFVYEMRREFDLFCKLNPIEPMAELRHAGRLKPAHVTDINVIVVRDNAGGIYQGKWGEGSTDNGERTASQDFRYSESQIRRLLRIAAAIARDRQGELAIVIKIHGVPTISRLWQDCAEEIAREYSIRLREFEIDNAAYQLIQDPRTFDVVATPNMFGDILADLGGILLGSRGLSFGGSFSASGAAVFQTNHGAAYDLTGTDTANPIGQIMALAMLLRESFGLAREAELIESAVAETLRRGYRTRDLAEARCHIVGTREMTDHIVEAVAVGAQT